MGGTPVRNLTDLPPYAARVALGGVIAVLLLAVTVWWPVWWPVWWSPDDAAPPPAEFGTISATVTAPDGARHDLCLLDAHTPTQRRRGLMGVTDRSLGGCDGMAFRFTSDQTTPFWMRNTPLPLSIGYFDARGRLVSTADMAPCGDRADCPRYPPSGPYRYAVEVLRGRLAEFGIVPGATLSFGDTGCRTPGQ